MAYEIGAAIKANWKGQIVTIDTKSIYTGFRAFARNEKTGQYHEILDAWQEQLWVDHSNQGAWRSGHHETKQGAVKAASAAYRKMNQKLAA